MDKTLVTFHQPKNQYSEAYRVLRTNLRFSNVDTDKKVILITSAKPGSGKTTTAANLAITMAKYSLKTLLIDADLRRPRIHELFGIQKGNGLTRYLLEKKDFENYINDIEGVENLHVLTSGVEPPDPSELLFSEKMKKLIEKAKETYDVIIIDSPPILVASDTSILATLADGIILVVSSNKSKIEDVLEAKEQIIRTGTKILGSVLNMSKTSSLGEDYY